MLTGQLFALGFFFWAHLLVLPKKQLPVVDRGAFQLYKTFTCCSLKIQDSFPQYNIWAQRLTFQTHLVSLLLLLALNVLSPINIPIIFVCLLTWASWSIKCLLLSSPDIWINSLGCWRCIRETLLQVALLHLLCSGQTKVLLLSKLHRGEWILTLIPGQVRSPVHLLKPPPPLAACLALWFAFQIRVARHSKILLLLLLTSDLAAQGLPLFPFWQVCQY